jgi:VWFA-related protein
MRQALVMLAPLAMLGIAALDVSALAQDRAATSPPVHEAVAVHVVNVDVIATGRRGKPVLNLKPEEFELFEDGQPVQLTNFLAPAPPPPESGAAAPAPGPSAVTVPPPPEEEQQRTLVVFVDDLNLSRLTRSLAFDRMGDFLAAQLRDGTREVVLSYDLGLRPLTPLTTDPAVVGAALKRVRGAVNAGTTMEAQHERIEAEARRGMTLDPPSARSVGEMAREDLRDERQMFGAEQADLETDELRALSRVMDSLAGLPGRKALLFVSDGVALGDAGAPDDRSQQLRNLVRDVGRHANAGRVTFYTLNVPPPGGNVTAETSGVPDIGSVTALDPSQRNSSLDQFTSATGGERLFNAGMLQHMATDLEAVYSLGYSPDHFGDGTYHRLEVKVARAGVALRYREGYLDKPVEQRQADRTAAALFAGGGGNPLGARLEIGKPERQGRREVAVPLTVLIPAANLVLLPNGDSAEGKVSITLAVSNAAGRRSAVHRQTFPIEVPSAALAGFLKRDTIFDFTVLVRPGDRTIAVTARDETAGVQSEVVADVPATGTNR